MQENSDDFLVFSSDRLILKLVYKPVVPTSIFNCIRSVVSFSVGPSYSPSAHSTLTRTGNTSFVQEVKLIQRQVGT